MAIDLSRTTSGVNLPASIAAEVWRDAQEASAVTSLGTAMSIPGNGVTVPLLTADVAANWVDETDAKPVSTPTFGNKNIKGYTLAVMVPVSNQFRRDADALYGELVRSLPGVLADKLDSTVFGGTTPGTGFDVATSAGALSLVGGVEAYEDLDLAVSSAGGVVDGWALSPQGKSLLVRAKDADGRPLFFNSYNEGGITNVGGARVSVARKLFKAGSPNQVGYAGQFSQNLFYGFVEGIKIDLFDQASLETDSGVISLPQRNMFALRVECEVGVAIRDLSLIKKLTDEAAEDSSDSSSD